MSLDVAKGQCYRFYRFWVITGKPTGGGGGGAGKINPLPQIRAKGVTDSMTAEIEEPDMGSW